MRPRIMLAAALPLIVTDLAAAGSFVDVLDNDGTWTVIDGGFTPGVGGLPPSAGTSYWGSTFHEIVTIGIQKTFEDQKVQAGNYHLEIDTSAPFVEPLDYQAVPLEDFEHFGLTGISSGMQVVSARTPEPGVVAWTTWVIEWDVEPDSPDIGGVLGFLAEVTPDPPYTVMLDNIRVTFTPAGGCPEDFDGSGDVGFSDLLALLSVWGPCSGCDEDLDGDGVVGFSDLLQLLTAWGPCV